MAATDASNREPWWVSRQESTFGGTHFGPDMARITFACRHCRNESGGPGQTVGVAIFDPYAVDRWWWWGESHRTGHGGGVRWWGARIRPLYNDPNRGRRPISLWCRVKRHPARHVTFGEIERRAVEAELGGYDVVTL